MTCLYLIQYNRKEGKLVSIQEFQESDRASAETARLKLELDAQKSKLPLEIVLLEAASEELLKRTHRRYFASVYDLST